jgi:hypothetical protein
MIEFFGLRHGINSNLLIWDTELARTIQIIYAESVRNGAMMRYKEAVESDETNKKFEQLEAKFDAWLLEQQ